MSTLMEQFLSDSTDTPTNDEMHEISMLAERQLLLEQKVKDAEKYLDSMKEELRQVQEFLLPEAMATVGMTEFKLSTGAKITVKDDVYASIRADYTGHAMDWLESNGLGDIIKDEVKVNFGKGDKTKAEAVVDFCQRAGYPVTERMTVHPQTLKAVVKEQLMRGVQFPEEYFSIAPVRKSVIKTK